MNFYRVCPVHKQPLVAEINGNVERLVCPNGHACESFITVSDTGKVIARAYRMRDDVIPGDIPDGIPRPPRKPCKHGHTEWSWQKSSRRYRCAACNRPSWKKTKENEANA